MILTKRPLAVIFTAMAAVIILYRLYVGTSDDYISVDAAFHATGTVTSVDKSENKYTVTIEDVNVLKGTFTKPHERLLLYVMSDNQIISKIKNDSNDSSSFQTSRLNMLNNIEKTEYELDNLKIGNTVEVRGKAEAFEKPGNPGQFDAYAYYMGKSYAYKVLADRCNIIDCKVSCREYLRNIADYCANLYEKYLPENEAGILSAMIFGRKNHLSYEDRELYKINGLMHILAVSGMHIETMSLIFLFIMTKLPVNFRVGRIFLFIILVLYGIITGFGVSCIRAVIMCGLKIMAELVGKTYDVLSAISFAAVITLLINPANLFRCDFILSYIAVTAIAVVYPALERGMNIGTENRGLIYHIIVKPMLFGVCINVTTLPMILFFYYDAALYSVFISIIIVPLISVLFLSGILCAVFGGIFPPAGMFLAGGIHFILSFYRVICEWCIDNLYEIRIIGYPGAVRIILCYVVIAAAVCAVRRIKNRRACIFLCAAFVILPLCILSYRRDIGLKITFLDVGQGDGIVIRMPDGKVVCVDGGSTDVVGLSKYRIEPYLSYEGIRHIDYWIVTHIDNDHYSGLKELLERRRYNGVVIDNIVIADTKICRGEFFNVFSDVLFDMKTETSADMLSDLISYVSNDVIDDIPDILYIDNNDRLEFGDAVLRCLSPVSSVSPGCGASYKYNNQNESSIVFELSYGSFNALFTGDIEGESEDKLHIDTGKRYELLKVAHHGSKNSTSETFLQKFLCSDAVISYGKKNRYGHPHRETVERLKTYGINVHNTAECGAVTVSVVENGYKIEENLLNQEK